MLESVLELGAREEAIKVDASLVTGLPNLKRLPSVARTAEAVGFDALWAGEARHEPFLPMPLIAEHTQRLQMGTSVAIAFARSPMVLAQLSWDLAAQSDGRFILGLGTQVKAHIERRFGMTWESPAAKLRETVLSIRAIWDCWQNGTPLNHRGQFYKLTLMSPFFNPGPIANPNIPIFVAGVNKALCEVAGEVADGLSVHSFHTAKYLREVIVPAVERGAAKSGRSRRDLQLSSLAFVVTDDVQREQARAQLAFYASTPSYRSVLACEGWTETGERLSRLAARGRWDEMPREITDEMLDQFAVVAKPAEVPGRLVAKYMGLLDRVALYESFNAEQDDGRYRDFVAGVHACSKD